jgi:hypothetical protein
VSVLAALIASQATVQITVSREQSFHVHETLKRLKKESTYVQQLLFAKCPERLGYRHQ